LLDKSIQIDKILNLLREQTNESDFEFLFEIYTNRRFSLPDYCKQRYATFHLFVQDSGINEKSKKKSWEIH
jgi:hypothetical protein